MNCKGRFFRVMAAAIVVATATAFGQTIWNGTANTAWYDAAKTQFTITTAEELAGLAQLVNDGNNFAGKTIKLDADIILNNTANYQNWETVPPANNWTAIGTNKNSKPFRGSFDGGDYVVSGVYINNSDDCQGLFGYMVAGSIQNLGIVYSYIKGDHFVGGLIGANDSICTITNCYSTANVIGGREVGGLVGQNYKGAITKCYAAGNVKYLATNPSGADGGGLAGSNYGGGTITNCYAAVNLSGGGLLVGHNSGTVANCYSSGTGTKPYGLIFYGDSAVNSYYDKETSGIVDDPYWNPTGRGTPKTTAEMKQKATFAGWDFDDVWDIKEGVFSPYLRTLGVAVSAIVVPSGITYTGDEIKFSTQSTKLKLVLQEGDTVSLTENTDYTASYFDNINAGTARAVITGIGAYSFIKTRTICFTIDKRNVNVNWGGTTLQWHGEPQAPTATSGEERFPLIVSGQQTEIGDYVATASSADSNIVLQNATTPFKITKRIIEVKWENVGPFIYNKMVQTPKAVATIDFGGGRVDPVRLTVTNSFSQVGKYTEQQAPLAQITDEVVRQNCLLTNNTIDYEILKKPLDIVLKDNSGNITSEVEVAKPAEITVGDAIESLKSFIGYNGFAKDTTTGETDNAANALSGAPKFEASKIVASQRSARDEVLRISDLLEKGEYVVNIKVSDIFAKNYELSDGQAIVKVSDSSVTFSMSRDDGTPIRDKKKSNNKHGILLEKAIVSQSAKINVKTPEQAQITLAVYDNAGNAVYKTSGRSTETFIWNLTNGAGRNVANGTYLVVVEAKGAKGTYAYSTKVGVKR